MKTVSEQTRLGDHISDSCISLCCIGRRPFLSWHWFMVCLWPKGLLLPSVIASNKDMTLYIAGHRKILYRHITTLCTYYYVCAFIFLTLLKLEIARYYDTFFSFNIQKSTTYSPILINLTIIPINFHHFVTWIHSQAWVLLVLNFK